jgi:PST family polysaccharide transporter
MAQRGRPELFSAKGPGSSSSDLRNSAIRGGVAMVMSRGAAQVLRLLITAILTRILSPDDFGLVAIVLAVVGIASLFQDMGLSAATVQRAEITPQQVSTLFWINAAMGAAACLAGVICSPLIADLYHRPEIATVTATLSLSFLLSGLMVQHNALLYRSMQFTTSARIGMIALVVAGATALGMAHAGFGPWALVAQTLVGDLVTLVLIWRVTRFRIQAFQWSPQVREMIGFGGQFLIFRILGYFAQNFQIVLIGKDLGASTAALYTRSNSLSRQLMGYVNDTSSQITNSALARLRDQPERYVRFYLRTLNVMFLAAAPIALFLGAFSSDVILFLFGPNWSTSADLLRILAVGMAGAPLLHSTGAVFFSHGDITRMMRWGIFGWIVMLLASVIGLRWGVTGVAWSWSLSMIGLMVPCAWYAFRGRGITLSACFKVIWPPLAAAALAAFIAFELAELLFGKSVFLRLPLEGAIFTIAYLGLAWSLFGQKPLIMELIDSLKKRKRSVAGPNDA